MATRSKKEEKTSKSKPESKPKANRGGKRAGSGRKTKAVNLIRADVNAAVYGQIVGVLPRLIANLILLADGVMVQKTSRAGDDDDVYLSPPDREAAKYLIDRVLGKPISAVELTGAGGGPIQHQVDLAALSDADLDTLATLAGKLAPSGPGGAPEGGGGGTGPA